MVGDAAFGELANGAQGENGSSLNKVPFGDVTANPSFSLPFFCLEFFGLFFRFSTV